MFSTSVEIDSKLWYLRDLLSILRRFNKIKILQISIILQTKSVKHGNI